MMNQEVYPEWLEVNNKGSYCIGAVDRTPSRKYHSLLTQRTPAHGEPLNWLLETLEVVNGVPLVEFNFGPHFTHGSAGDQQVSPAALKNFYWEKGLVWNYQVGSVAMSRKLTLHPHFDVITLEYEFSGLPGKEVAEFEFSPLMLVRSWHKLTQENIVFNGALRTEKNLLALHPYEGLGDFYFQVEKSEGGKSRLFDLTPAVVQKGHWYKGISYRTELDRGYPFTEDAFVPGSWMLPVANGHKVVIHMGPDLHLMASDSKNQTKARLGYDAKNFLKSLQASAQSYLAETDKGFVSIIAGYPWFESWGRDTMLALPGLLLSTGQVDLAQKLLSQWAKFFFKHQTEAEAKEPLNLSGLDTPLLFVRALKLLSQALSTKDRKKYLKELFPDLKAFVSSYFAGEVPWVKINAEGFWVEAGPFASGWMDAVIDGRPVTPRHGYAVDLCALWIEGLQFLIQIVESDLSGEREMKEFAATQEFLLLKTMLKSNREGFKKLFWIEDKGYLADLNDGQSQNQQVRPNQLWALAIGSPLLSSVEGERLLSVVEQELLTPKGLRTLSPHDPQYHGRYVGDQGQRDRAYHQGTVWPWLMGIYMDAAFAVRGEKFMSRASALLEGLREHYYSEACFGQISEIFDGDAPWIARGTPAQAWSVSEVLRIEVLLQSMGVKTLKVSKPVTATKPLASSKPAATAKAASPKKAVVSAKASVGRKIVTASKTAKVDKTMTKLAATGKILKAAKSAKGIKAAKATKATKVVKAGKSAKRTVVSRSTM